MSKGVVLVLGARSDIARAVALRFAAKGHPIQLAARQSESLSKDKTDIELRHKVPVTVHEFDALDVASHAAFVDALPELPRIAVSAIGFMGAQAENETDVELAIRVMRSNYEGPASIFSHLATRFAGRGSGTLVGISSVAGERGRATNYIYGSAKAGFTAFLSGLRNRLAEDDVHVLTVLPGFVATRMTEDMDLPERLTAKPEEVADAIVKAVAAKRNVIHVRRIWWLIMLIIRNIPERIFKRMKI
ncbi:SDR family oxidoreductase [Roseisalinus antarcticus]|uniref:Fatty acyl-CoA reductase n=1 Tax=Roseisalinus antarcticus TaxID=254357 RepID=A0A1Y5TS30_9RHOB|nr:SDR family oxidoreductase [Roseisalinus antarcticus]SLN70534.1 Fatty acyl-CoA reductase [Roseisalinus antarcticus]